MLIFSQILYHYVLVIILTPWRQILLPRTNLPANFANFMSLFQNFAYVLSTQRRL